MITILFMLLACGDKDQDTSIEAEETEEQLDTAVEEEELASKEE